MRKKGWFVFFCLLLLSFELVRPAEIVWFGGPICSAPLSKKPSCRTLRIGET